MNGYTVTVAPDDTTEATATIHYELDGGTPRVTDFHLSAAAGQSLSNAHMPDIDIAQLLAAVMPTIATTPATAALSASRLDADVEVAAAGPAFASVATDEPATVADVPKRRQARKPKPVKAAPARKTRTIKDTAPTSPPTKHTAATKPTRTAKATSKAQAAKANVSSTAETTGRVRRLMPDDFPQTYNNQASTVAALADAYGVPRHTAQGWINTARKRGLIEPARSRAS
jgi:hypothetical protein